MSVGRRGGSVSEWHGQSDQQKHWVALRPRLCQKDGHHAVGRVKSF
jgi:hypothetical protein